MEIKKCEFITSAVLPSQYPETELPEIAFVGRSNVGKSSLINSLLNRKKMVKVSSSPGKTRLINFFSVNDELSLVDLPGYGYAAVSRSEKGKWGKMIENYLVSRTNLTNVVLLVDIRHKPTADDKLMYQFIKYYRHTAIIVATKLDKISKNTISKNLKEIRDTLNIGADDMLFPYSSENHQRRDELWDIIMEHTIQAEER